jgi:DNA-binding response OmpR family regulator
MANASNRLPTATVLVVLQKRAVAKWLTDRLWIGECLREAGYVVAVAKSYDDALSALCLIEPDAVVISATKLDGDTEQFVGRLESDPHAIRMPIVLVSPTKSQTPLAHIAARKNPRVGYLSWPVKCRDLRLIMQDLLQAGTQSIEPIPDRYVVLDPRFRVLRGRSGATIVTPGEYRVADYLISQRGRPVALREVQDRVFSIYPGDGDLGLIRAHVASLRQKIKIVTGGSDLIRPAGKGGIVYLGGRKTAPRRPQLL